MTLLIAIVVFFAALTLVGARALRTTTGRRAGLDLALRRAHALRVPVFALAALAGGPTAMRGNALLENLLVLETGGAAFIVGLFGALMAGMAIWSAILVTQHGPARFGQPDLALAPGWPSFFAVPEPGRPSVRPALWVLLVTAPLIFEIGRSSAEGGGLSTLAAMASGVSGVVGGILVLVLFWWGGLHFDRWAQKRLMRAGEFLNRYRGLRDGYFDRATGRLYTGHVIGVFGLLVLGLGHLGLGWLFDPTTPAWDGVPTLAALIALGILFVVAAAGACFFFDRFRFPVLLVFVGLVMVPGVFDREPELPVVASKKLAPATRDQVFGEDGPVIVVCAAGGGIQAAGWTARVLTECDRGLGDFGRRLRLFSGVSGGSVGGLHYLAARRGRGAEALSEEERDRVLAAATQSALAPVGQALVLNDVLPFGLGGEDRGRALEAAFARAAGEDHRVDDRLSDWMESARNGTMPAVVLNATVATRGDLGASGDLFAFSTIALGAGISTFDTRITEHDVDVVTAARASATFPWITPMAGFPGKRGRLADGGYHDNLGFSSALRVLEDLLEDPALAERKIAVICIESFPATGENQDPRSLAGSPLLGPLSLLLDVREATQGSRARTELDLLQRAFGRVANATTGALDWRLKCFEIRPRSAGDDAGQPPLSWHLSRTQREHLQGKGSGSAWGPDQAGVLTAIEKHLENR